MQHKSTKSILVKVPATQTYSNEATQGHSIINLPHTFINNVVPWLGHHFP